MRLIDADALIEFCAERWIPLNIDAVNMQPTIQPDVPYTNVGDIINRQATINIVKKGYGNTWIDRAMLIEELKDLPSAQLKRKKGYWKHINEEEERAKHNGQLLGWMPWYCSECGCGVGKHQTAFCPNCGADMRGEQNE